MAASDVSILAAGSEALPLTYTIPPTQAFQVKAASASFDGTGASGTFTPVLTIRNDAGLVVARCLDASQTTAAGGSVEPSWFPHVAHRASAAAAGLPWAIASFDPAGMSVASDGADHYFSIQDTGGASKFDTSHPAIFTNGSTTAFTGSAVFGVQVLVPGTVQIAWNIQWIAQGTTGRGISGYYSMDTGLSGPSFFQLGRTSALTGDNWDHAGAAPGLPHISGFEFQSTDAGSVPSTIAPFATVQSGGASTVTAQIAVVYLGSYVATRI